MFLTGINGINRNTIRDLYYISNNNNTNTSNNNTTTTNNTNNTNTTKTNSTTNSTNVTEYAQKSGKKRVFDNNVNIPIDSYWFLGFWLELWIFNTHRKSWSHAVLHWNRSIPGMCCVCLCLVNFQKLTNTSYNTAVLLPGFIPREYAYACTVVPVGWPYGMHNRICIYI
jgi:hypothetical protein